MAAAPAPSRADGICIPGIPSPTCPPSPSPPPTGPPGGSPAPAPSRPPEPSGCALERTRGSGGFVGIISEDTFVGGENYRRCQFSAQAGSAISIIREAFRWSDIEPSKGNYSFSYYDDFVAEAARHGIAVLPILFDPPSFRARHGSARGTYPPRSNADMGRFAAKLVQRYGPNGTLWRERSGVPRVPIRAWQVWNEPNIPPYWPTGPNPREYTALLKATSRAIKRADPGAEVVTAGIPDSDLGIRYRDFIKGMYRAGAKSAFDTLAVHPYAASASGVVGTTRRARALMNRYGDRRARIWLTEVGWASGGPATRFTFSEGGQAGRVGDVLRRLWKERGRLRVRGVAYFAWKDAPPYSGRSDFWGYHTGLLDINGRQKPSFFAFRNAALSLR